MSTNKSHVERLHAILTQGMAPMIASEPWNAVKHAQAVMDALRVLATEGNDPAEDVSNIKGKTLTHAVVDDLEFDEAMASIPTIVGGVEQTAPRVTIEQIEAEIASEHYFTAADGAPRAFGAEAVKLRRTLFCVLILKNGMRVEGVNHGSVSAANYSVEYARKDAREKAIDKLWPMFGFELAQKLYKGSAQ